MGFLDGDFGGGFGGGGLDGVKERERGVLGGERGGGGWEGERSGVFFGWGKRW